VELPTGFTEVREGKFLILTRPVYYELAVSIARQDPETLLARAAASGGNGGSGETPGPHAPPAGRGTVVELPGEGGTSLILKKNRRGGLYARFRGDVHRTDYEATVELFLSETAWKKGVPVALVGFVMAAPAGEGKLASWWRGYCATIKVEGARSMMDLFSSPMPPAKRRLVIAAAAEAVAKAHNRGFYHGDLNLGNILIVQTDQGDYGGWLIDLGHSTIGGTLRLRPRLRNLMRLYRSAEKWLPPRDEAETRQRQRDIVRFLRVYTGRRRGEVRRHLEGLSRRRASLLLHRIGWKAVPPRAI
jgi:hypothetical protein